MFRSFISANVFAKKLRAVHVETQIHSGDISPFLPLPLQAIWPSLLPQGMLSSRSN